MAGIDHTRICFHNGKLMRHEPDEEIFPFKYNRDALIYEIEDKWQDEKEMCDYIARYICDDKYELTVYESDEFNVIYFLDFKKDENYVILGGYGHYANPYTHLYGRGLPEEIERMLMSECYEWLMEDIIKDCCEALAESIWDVKDLVRDYQKDFGYKGWYDMTEEERDNYEKWKPIEVE